MIDQYKYKYKILLFIGIFIILSIFIYKKTQYETFENRLVENIYNKLEEMNKKTNLSKNSTINNFVLSKGANIK